MDTKRPLVICLTSTRNYGWCTKSFMEANTLWADYIIVVDQMSTDDTRSICARYPNVIVVDNKNLCYSETIRCELAINKAREIEGDKILVYLAIDEVLSSNAVNSRDWEKMLNSKQGEVGLLSWANLCDEGRMYSSPHKKGSPFWMARIFHDDGLTPYNNDCLDMHTHCIPYPTDAKEFFINEFVILHFEGLNKQWSLDKQRYYQFVDFDKNHRSAVTLDRMYSGIRKKEKFPMNKEWVNFPVDIISLLNLEHNDFFDKQIIGFIEQNGISSYKSLNVWDKEFIGKYSIKDPRTFPVKLLHCYLNLSRKAYSRDSILVRAIDKVLKRII